MASVQFSQESGIAHPMKALVAMLLAMKLHAAFDFPALELLTHRSAILKMKAACQARNLPMTMTVMPGEKVRVRLALSLLGTPLGDNRLGFFQWMEDDGEMSNSLAMLRWAGSLGDSSLYPQHDREKLLKIEEMLHLGEELEDAFNYAVTADFATHEWTRADEVFKERREAFLATDLQKCMSILEAELQQTGAFLVGDKPTIADCHWFPQVEYLTAGLFEHIPKDCLRGFQLVAAWRKRVMALPEVRNFYREPDTFGILR